MRAGAGGATRTCLRRAAVQAWPWNFRVSPRLEARALELYLQTAVYARDTRRVELAANALRVAQMPEAVIEARIDDARTRRPDTNAE